MISIFCAEAQISDIEKKDNYLDEHTDKTYQSLGVDCADGHSDGATCTVEISLQQKIQSS